MKNILVTGAYGGMGRAVTEALRKQGARVFALDRTVGESGGNIVPVQADTTTEAGVTAAVAVVRAHTQRLDAILHFAGVYMLDSLVEMDEAQFRRIFEVNLFGVYRVNKAFLPLLDRGGRILITTSELAPLDPLPFTGIYAVTKSALDKYAWALRMELQLLVISVSVLRAGAVNTGMLGASTDALDHFCADTKLYTCNAGRFRDIVARVEARCIPPEQLADKVLYILAQKKPGFAYSINRNPLLLLLNALPKGMQLWIIRKILT